MYVRKGNNREMYAGKGQSDLLTFKIVSTLLTFDSNLKKAIIYLHIPTNTKHSNRIS